MCIYTCIHTSLGGGLDTSNCIYTPESCPFFFCIPTMCNCVNLAYTFPDSKDCSFRFQVLALFSFLLVSSCYWTPFSFHPVFLLCFLLCFFFILFLSSGTSMMFLSLCFCHFFISSCVPAQRWKTAAQRWKNWHTQVLPHTLDGGELPITYGSWVNRKTAKTTQGIYLCKWNLLQMRQWYRC